MVNLRIAVLKFGGTSVSTPEGREWALKHILKNLEDGYSVAVVASAMGRSGDPYATDTLISLLGKAMVPKRDMDLLMSCGEIISTVVLANHLDANGLKAVPLTGSQAGIVTNEEYGESSIVNIDSRKVRSYLEAGKIPIVAGFQGRSFAGEITTIGRGGSDITAIALAAALSADNVEIYKDVPGIMTGDPKVNPDAVLLRQVSAGRLLLMAQNGAKVIHHRAVSMAMENRINFHVRNNFTDEPGTLVYATEEKFVSAS